MFWAFPCAETGGDGKEGAALDVGEALTVILRAGDNGAALSTGGLSWLIFGDGDGVATLDTGELWPLLFGFTIGIAALPDVRRSDAPPRFSDHRDARIPLPSSGSTEGVVAGVALFSFWFGKFGEVSARIRWKDSSRCCFSSGDKSFAGEKNRGMSSAPEGRRFSWFRSFNFKCGGACLLEPRVMLGGEPTLRSPNASEMICWTLAVGAASGVGGGALTPLLRGVVRVLFVICCAVFVAVAARSGDAEVVLVCLEVLTASGFVGDRGDIGVDGPAFFLPAELSVCASCIVTSATLSWVTLPVLCPWIAWLPDGFESGPTVDEVLCSSSFFAFIGIGLELVKAVRFLRTIASRNLWTFSASSTGGLDHADPGGNDILSCSKCSVLLCAVVAAFSRLADECFYPKVCNEVGRRFFGFADVE